MSATPRIHRFDFNSLRDFRGPIVVNTAENLAIDLAPPTIVAPIFSEEDLESVRVAGRKQGYGEGFAAGQLEAKKQADAKADAANELIASLADMVKDMQARYGAMLVDESAQLSQLILSVARKVAGNAIDERGEHIVQGVVTQCLPVIFSKPRVIIELNPALFETTMERIESQLRVHGFEGEIQFKGNSEFGLSDITLDWGSGQITRSAATLWSEVETIIERVPHELTFADTLNLNNTTGA
jgi:flagellar assembly protein FliH